jgi:nucleoside 2-deoxyribosyltransferase
MLIYVAGPYSGTPEEIERNVESAAKIAAELWRIGHAVICPHTNSHLVSKLAPDITYEQWIRGDINMLARCDAIVMLPNWQQSRGAVAEFAYAQQIKMPIYEVGTHELPDLHPTELRAPIQCRAFRETLGRMYRTHLDKNADYSPANILATGELGLVTRLWDKVARLMNLAGFRFVIEPDSVKYQAPAQPKNESVEDTLMDAAVYSIIGLLLRRGHWGR